MRSRREFLKTSAMAGAGAALPLSLYLRRAGAEPAALGLSDPALQPKFTEPVPNALDPSFILRDLNPNQLEGEPDYRIRARETVQQTGLIDPRSGNRLRTRVYGYGQEAVSWPGPTIEVTSRRAGGPDQILVQWINDLRTKRHLLPLDTSLHWCYSLHGESSRNGVDYRQFSIERHGVPMITHLHGAPTDFQYDGNPEFFYNRSGSVIGPQWDFVPGGFTNIFRYNNDVAAENFWYHDHALGITRLNVYAGLAGFYFARDDLDTGSPDNALGLPMFPYELAYVIQDRMFTAQGALFFPAFPGDPTYSDFIDDEGVVLPPDLFPGGGPTVLAEFFGDHIVVNGKIWPKADVEPRNYRMRLLNGCDSRTMVLQFVAVNAGETDPSAGTPIPFWIIGADQGLGTPAQTELTVFEPGARYNLVVDFSQVSFGSRVIMKNLAADVAFDGTFGAALDPADLFPDRQTDRVMAFDVVVPFDRSVEDRFDPGLLPEFPGVPGETTVRRVGLFEGKDNFGRLQPLLGTVADDLSAATAYTWFEETTEKPVVGSTEEWQIFNFTPDAHPIHLHLVNFQTLGRHEISFERDDANPQQVRQHDGTFGSVPAISDIQVGASVELGPADGYFTASARDEVTALPEQVTIIKARFDKAGRYVWHCHILSHEDHEMMRVLEVVEP